MTATDTTPSNPSEPRSPANTHGTGGATDEPSASHRAGHHEQNADDHYPPGGESSYPPPTVRGPNSVQVITPDTPPTLSQAAAQALLRILANAKQPEEPR